ncbi:MAG: prohibitin family protein [Ruminococcaceae bacterium]|nr:prohibitin family protein [Oscillospiraceae bacterium]
MDHKQKELLKKVLVILIPVVLVIIVLASSIVVVDAGHTGVVVTLGSVNEGVLEEGVHLKIPFVQKVVKINNRITKLEVATEAFSKDLQTVSTTLAINYRVDSEMSYSIYKNIGSSYEDVLMAPAVNEVLKAITAKYTAEESVTNRSLISEGLVKGLNDKLNAAGLYITDVNIINFDFSDAFITAIEEKQVAQQQLLKAETEKQTAITNAEAEAESVRIKAEAQAEANKILSQSLTDEIIDYNKVEKWNGELPMVTGDADPFISLEGLQDDEDDKKGN